MVTRPFWNKHGIIQVITNLKSKIYFETIAYIINILYYSNYNEPNARKKIKLNCKKQQNMILNQAKIKYLLISVK